MARSSKTGGKRKSAAPTRKARPAKRRIRPTTRLKRSAAANDELKEAREQQAATAEILKVIASSPSDVRPVFESIAASANRLIGGFSTAVHLVIEDTVRLQAYTG
jgi:two-component system, NtrC family, sensor kinase